MYRLTIELLQMRGYGGQEASKMSGAISFEVIAYLFEAHTTDGDLLPSKGQIPRILTSQEVPPNKLLAGAPKLSKREAELVDDGIH